MSVIRRILCKMGFHRWRCFIVHERSCNMIGFYHLRRHCMRCEKVEDATHMNGLILGNPGSKITERSYEAA